MLDNQTHTSIHTSIHTEIKYILFILSTLQHNIARQHISDNEYGGLFIHYLFLTLYHHIHFSLYSCTPSFIIKYTLLYTCSYKK